MLAMFAAICMLLAAQFMTPVYGAVSLTITANTPSDQTSISQLATSLLAGAPGYYFGSIPASNVQTVCDALVNQGANVPINAAVTAYGTTTTYNLQVSNIGGCGASSASPAGVQAVLTDSSSSSSSQRKYAVLCGNYVNGGLDATTPVQTCAVYLTGSDISSQYNSLKGRRRSLLQNNCVACLENCVCTNVNKNCFPGDAEVRVEGRGPVRMAELAVGDKVLVSDGASPAKYEQVMFFGHEESQEVMTTLSLTAETLEGRRVTLEATHMHFIPVIAAGGMYHKYMKDVQIGDKVWVLEGENQVQAEVTSKSIAQSVGMYNPYTEGGYIVVNDVVASAHSNFILDSVTPERFTHLLPYVYQAMLLPVRLASRILGPKIAKMVSDCVVPHINALDSTGLVVAAALFGGLFAGANSVKKLHI